MYLETPAFAVPNKVGNRELAGDMLGNKITQLIIFEIECDLLSKERNRVVLERELGAWEARDTYQWD